MAIGGLSNVFAMTQMVNNDFQTSQKLANMGCKMPSPEEAAKIHKEHPEMNLSEITAQGCPKDDVKLSKAVQNELHELHDKNSAIAAGMQSHQSHQASQPKGGLTEIMSKMEAQQADFKKAQGISGQIQNDSKLKISDQVAKAYQGFAGGK